MVETKLNPSVEKLKEKVNKSNEKKEVKGDAPKTKNKKDKDVEQKKKNEQKKADLKNNAPKKQSEQVKNKKEKKPVTKDTSSKSTTDKPSSRSRPVSSTIPKVVAKSNARTPASEKVQTPKTRTRTMRNTKQQVKINKLPQKGSGWGDSTAKDCTTYSHTNLQNILPNGSDSLRTPITGSEFYQTYARIPNPTHTLMNTLPSTFGTIPSDVNFPHPMQHFNPGLKL